MLQAQGFKIHREVPSLDAYYSELDELSDLLKARPLDFEKKYTLLLEQSKEQKKDELTSVLYILNGSYFYYQRALNSSRLYFDKAIQLAEKANNTKLERTTQIRRIFCDEYIKSALEQSRLMEEEYLASKKSNDTINMIYNLNGLGLFYSQMDSTELAMKPISPELGELELLSTPVM